MATASKRGKAKAIDAAEKARDKSMPNGHKRLDVFFKEFTRRRRVFRFARYELQTDGVTTVLRIFELSTNREFMFPFQDVKEVRT